MNEKINQKLAEIQRELKKAYDNNEKIKVVIILEDNHAIRAFYQKDIK